MISFHTGNLLDAPGIPVIPVNCVGVMGKGLAKQAADKWPWVEAEYKRVCKSEIFNQGDIRICHSEDGSVLLFATKRHWAYPSRIEWIEQGLKALSAFAEQDDEYCLPKLGCGLGGLDWADVKPLMVKYLKDAPGAFNIYE